MVTNYVALGKKIKKFRKQKGLSQEELAEKCDLSTSYISYIENGKRNFSLSQLEKLSKILDFKIDIYQYSSENKFQNISDNIIFFKFLSKLSKQEKRILYKAIILIIKELKGNLSDCSSHF